MSGWWAFSAFRSAGATTAQALDPLQGEAITGFFILTAGLLHWVVPRLRLPLAVAGVFGGFYGSYFLYKSSNLLSNWNIFQGDIISAGNWSEAIQIAIAVLCAIELVILARTSA